MNSSRIGIALVTGGCGFVGRHLVKTLLDVDVKVVLVDNLCKGISPKDWLSNKERQNLTYIEGDVRDFFSLNSSFDYVYHLAAVIGGRVGIDFSPLTVSENISIDEMFFRWLIKNKPRLGALYPSSSAVYPVNLQDKDFVVLTEDLVDVRTRTIGFPDMTYGWAKMTGEFLVSLVRDKYKIDIKVIRPFSGYGIGQDEDYPVTAIAKRVLDHQNPLEIWGPEKQGRDFVYISDVMRAILAIQNSDNKDEYTYNIGSEKVTTFNEVGLVLAKLEGYTPIIKNLIDKPTGVLNRVGSMTKLATLGWKPLVSLEVGMQYVLNGLKDGLVV